jgi:hypothetical protein
MRHGFLIRRRRLLAASVAALLWSGRSALGASADRSFVGVVTRISRTEYTVRFQIRDAHTGALVIARLSDLRIGADYSWNRGAAALINSLLDNIFKPIKSVAVKRFWPA